MAQRPMNPFNLKPGHQIILGNRLIIVTENLGPNAEGQTVVSYTTNNCLVTGPGTIVFSSEDPIMIEN